MEGETGWGVMEGTDAISDQFQQEPRGWWTSPERVRLSCDEWTRSAFKSVFTERWNLKRSRRATGRVNPDEDNPSKNARRNETS